MKCIIMLFVLSTIALAIANPIKDTRPNNSNEILVPVTNDDRVLQRSKRFIGKKLLLLKAGLLGLGALKLKKKLIIGAGAAGLGYLALKNRGGNSGGSGGGGGYGGGGYSNGGYAGGDHSSYGPPEEHGHSSYGGYQSYQNSW